LRHRKVIFLVKLFIILKEHFCLFDFAFIDLDLLTAPSVLKSYKNFRLWGVGKFILKLFNGSAICKCKGFLLLEMAVNSWNLLNAHGSGGITVGQRVEVNGGVKGTN
jgi:hypothetical protein